MAAQARKQATLALVIALVSYLFCCGIGHVVSLVMSYYALRGMARANSREARGQAIAANVLSWIGLVGMGVYILGAILVALSG